MVVTALASLTQLSILARILDPKTFGEIAILMIVIGFAQAFMDMGVSNAIIHRQAITHSQLSSLYWLNLFAGLVLSTIVYLMAPYIAIFYKEPALQHPMKLLALVFLVVAFGNQYRILCQKELQFNIMAIIDIVSAIAALVVAISSAFNNFGIYTLVLAMLTQASVSSASYLVVGLRTHHVPSLTFNHNELKGFYSFGLYQMGERAINYISANIDKLLIGKMLGMEAVGFYNMAWQLIIFPLGKINPIVNNVAFPIYAKIQTDSESLNNYYSITVKSLSIVTIPLLAFLSIFSAEIVLAFFGSGWDVTANLVTLLALVGILKALGNPGGAILLSKGYANIGFWWNLFWALSITSGIYSALIFRSNIEIVPWVLLGLSILVGWIWHYLVAKFAGIRYWSLLVHFAKTIFVSFMIAFVAANVISLINIDYAYLRIIVAVLICLALYAPYLWLFENPLINKLMR